MDTVLKSVCDKMLYVKGSLYTSIALASRALRQPVCNKLT